MNSACTYTEQIIVSPYTNSYGAGPPAASLVWVGDHLVDWVAGGNTYFVDGTAKCENGGYSYRFDAAITEPEGEFAVIYTRLGTKGLLLRRGKVGRELNRSFYHADDYEYPVALVRHEGRALLIHCPQEYNKLEIEDAATGEVLTARSSESADFFHSRLAASPGGRYFLSAGWVWHPWDGVVYYDLSEALRHPEYLDTTNPAPPSSLLVGATETSSAAWSSENEMLLGASAEDDEPIDETPPGAKLFRPCGLVSYDLHGQAFRTACVLAEPVGTLMPVGSTHAMSFFRHPKLIRLSDGAIEFSLPWISSGTQIGSILRGLDPILALALDPEHRRFAIAQADKVHIVTIVLPDVPLPATA